MSYVHVPRELSGISHLKFFLLSPATDRPAPQGLHRDVRGDAVQVRPPHLVRALRVQRQADHHTKVHAVQEVFTAVPKTCELAPRSVVTCQISG